MRTLLIVEDDAGLRDQMKWAFREAFDIREADSLETALAAVRGPGDPGLVCLDMGLEGRPDRGLDVLDALLSADPACKVVAVTGNRDEALGREAIRRGAFDYLSKPADPDALRVLFERALRIRDLEEPSWSPVAGKDDEASAGLPLLGSGEALQKVFAALRRLGPGSADVLFTGEPGTGRESAARALHALGPSKDGPFVAVPCAGIPEELLEAEIFGRPRDIPGSPGESRPGAVEAARGGTLFLDGVEDLPLSLQGRILRWMREGAAPGLEAGPDSPSGRPRLMASACRGTGGAAPSAFATTLLRALGEFEVALPPLRDRGRDVLVLAQALVERNRARFASPRLRLSARAEKRILAHAWPGNARELEDRINRAALSCRGQVIEDSDLGIEEAVGEGFNYREQKRIFERNLLLNALKRTNGNVSLAARTMGVTRPTFYDMMKKSGVVVRMEPRI